MERIQENDFSNLIGSIGKKVRVIYFPRASKDIWMEVGRTITVKDSEEGTRNYL